MQAAFQDVLKVITFPIENGFIPMNPDHHVLFLNGAYCEGLGAFSEGTIEAVQVFKPAYTSLRETGSDVQPDIRAVRHPADTTLIALPKNQIEAKGLIAHGLVNTKQGGHVCIAAGNKAGGSRIVKTLKKLGVEDVQQDTMSRCRVVWFTLGGFDKEEVQAAIEASKPQAVLNGEYMSEPGIYGWDKIDKGSALLIQKLEIPQFKVGADFGCGYGYLSREILKHVQPEIWACFDADWRAVQMCGENLRGLDAQTELRYDWLDLTQPLRLREPLDFIVMNPPFHEGQKGKPEIGNAFIKRAAESLKPKGQLWMVANNHLPYEQVLQTCFKDVEKRAEEQGFKVYKAVK